MDNLYQCFDGFSEGMMAHLNEEKKNRHLSDLGVTIVYGDFPRRVYVCTDASPKSVYYVNEANLRTGDCRKVDSLGIDPKELIRVEVFGHAYFHPEMYGLNIPEEGSSRCKRSATKWYRYKENPD